MDDFIKHKVLYLLMHGWSDLAVIQEHLAISDKDMQRIVNWLIEEEYLVSYTVH